MYTGPCSKDEELKKELGETSSSSLEGASVEVPCEVGTHLGDNAEKKDDKNWRKGDATTFRQQGVRVDVTQEKQSFTQGIFQRLIKGGTQESEDTATTKQEAKAYPSKNYSPTLVASKYSLHEQYNLYIY